MSRIDTVFVSTNRESKFPLVRVKALDRVPSDHNPLVLDTGDNTFFWEKRGLDLKNGG